MSIRNPTLCDVLKVLSLKVSLKEFLLPVRRGHILEDTLRSVKRKSFSPDLTLKVYIIYI